MNSYLRKILKKCKHSPRFFIENFCKVEHPQAGILDFKLFEYQEKIINDFETYRFSIFKKTRQCGISTLTGAYALWYAMFHTHKKVLVVSKRDLDAKEFLRKNVKFVFNNLPDWMKEIFHGVDNAFNEHKVEFKSGSSITSLTSHPETLRSNSASVVIIDEAAFMQHMDKMWAAGWPTMQHGGRAIVISTTSGVGNWYWATWTDAEAGTNEFHPIRVDWWDMNWEIPIKDDKGNIINTIAPCKDIVPCKTPEKKEKYGPYWSPWLEEQYRALQKKGDDSKFRQEVLAQFVGTGQTVLSGAVLRYLGEQLEKNKGKEGWEYKVMDEPLVYVDEVTGENFTLDFKKELWIFDEPREGHEYSVGFDLSGGENKDFSAIVVWDMTTRSQVAELNIKNEPKYTARMAVWIANYYNNAVLVIDRTGLGLPIVQMVEHEIGYTNLWKFKKNPTDKGKTGLPISPATKPILNRVLRDNLGLDGWDVVSQRLYKQLLIYINLGGGRTGNETGPGNRDDIVMAAALGLLAAVDPTTSRAGLVLPFRTESLSFSKPDADIPKNFNRALMPMIGSQFGEPGEYDRKLSIDQELMKFVGQLGGMKRHIDESPEEYRERMKSEMKKTMPATVFRGQDHASKAASVSKTVNLTSRNDKNVTRADRRKSYKSVTVRRKHKL